MSSGVSSAPRAGAGRPFVSSTMAYRKFVSSWLIFYRIGAEIGTMWSIGLIIGAAALGVQMHMGAANLGYSQAVALWRVGNYVCGISVEQGTMKEAWRSFVGNIRGRELIICTMASRLGEGKIGMHTVSMYYSYMSFDFLEV